MKDEKELKETKLDALSHVKAILSCIRPLEKVLANLEEQYKFHRQKYREAEYGLAEMDERMRKAATRTHGKKLKPLTLEQIKRVAKQLEVEL